MPALFARSSRISFHKSFPFEIFNFTFVGIRNLDWASRKPAVHLSLATMKEDVPMASCVFFKESATRLVDPRVLARLALHYFNRDETFGVKKQEFNEIASSLVRIIIGISVLQSWFLKKT